MGALNVGSVFRGCNRKWPAAEMFASPCQRVGSNCLGGLWLGQIKHQNRMDLRKGRQLTFGHGCDRSNQDGGRTADMLWRGAGDCAVACDGFGKGNCNGITCYENRPAAGRLSGLGQDAR